MYVYLGVCLCVFMGVKKLKASCCSLLSCQLEFWADLSRIVGRTRNSAQKFYHYRPQGKVMFSQTSVSHSVRNRPHGYSVTAHPCYSAVGMHPSEMLSCYILHLLTFFDSNISSSKETTTRVATTIATTPIYLIQISFQIFDQIISHFCLIVEMPLAVKFSNVTPDMISVFTIYPLFIFILRI